MRTSLLVNWTAGLIGALALVQPGAAQPIRGKGVFDQRNCVTCHAEDGSAGDDGIPPIRGPYFMTRTKPGSLAPQEVADVTAYQLKVNELPAAAARVRFTDARPVR